MGDRRRGEELLAGHKHRGGQQAFFRLLEVGFLLGEGGNGFLGTTTQTMGDWRGHRQKLLLARLKHGGLQGHLVVERARVGAVVVIVVSEACEKRCFSTNTQTVRDQGRATAVEILIVHHVGSGSAAKVVLK